MNGDLVSPGHRTPTAPLAGAREATTPIGCKLVFERWANDAGEQFGRVRLLYQGVDQLLIAAHSIEPCT